MRSREVAAMIAPVPLWLLNRHRHDLLILNGSQQLRLSPGGQLGDFVKKHSAVSSDSEHSRLTVFHAKQLSFSISTGRVPQFTARNFSSLFGPAMWISRANSSLPVPVSPTSRTLLFVAATLRMVFRRFCRTALERRSGQNRHCAPSPFAASGFRDRGPET